MESTLAVAKLLTLCYSFKLPWRDSSLHKCFVLNGLYRVESGIAGAGPSCPVEMLWKTSNAGRIVPVMCRKRRARSFELDRLKTNG